MTRPLSVLRAVPASAALVLALGAATTGCNNSTIPGTSVPDSIANREAVDFVEQYRHAVESREPAAILRLVSTEYFDDNGTPNSDDDIDYGTLQERLTAFSTSVLDVRYEMRYRRVEIYPHRTYVDVTYTSSFKLRTPDGDRWGRRVNDNRIELVREDGEFRIVSGL